MDSSTHYQYPLPAGFQAFYEQNIWPRLHVDDEIRVKAIRTFILSVFGLAMTSIVVAWLWYLFSIPIDRWTTTPTVIIFLGIYYGLHSKYLGKTRANLKDTLVKPTFAFFGWEYSRTVSSPPDTKYLAEFGLLEKHASAKFEDGVRGKIRKLHFEMTEVRCLNPQNRYHNRTPFHGLLLVIQHPLKFDDQTVVLRKRRRPVKAAKLKRVGLVDPVFREVFQAYSTDQVEARYLLTPDVMHRLFELELAVHGKNIQFGFVKNHLWVTIETNDRYEGGSLFSSLTQSERVHELLNEIYALRDLVDGLAKPQSPDSFNT